MEGEGKGGSTSGGTDVQQLQRRRPHIDTRHGGAAFRGGVCVCVCVCVRGSVVDAQSDGAFHRALLLSASANKIPREREMERE